jgi:prepilin-type processing-associated H-X9-DG protein
VNYFVSGPVTDSRCPVEDDPKWFGDAGSSWSETGWRSTLYNHAITPNGSPSCVARDFTTALMGASSGHLQGVNVLMFDGSVRTVSPGIDSRVWKAMATTSTPTPEPANPPSFQEHR